MFLLLRRSMYPSYIFQFESTSQNLGGKCQKITYQTIFAVNVGVITHDIGDSGCKLQIVLDMY